MLWQKEKGSRTTGQENSIWTQCSTEGPCQSPISYLPRQHRLLALPCALCTQPHWSSLLPDTLRSPSCAFVPTLTSHSHPLWDQHFPKCGLWTSVGLCNPFRGSLCSQNCFYSSILTLDFPFSFCWHLHGWLTRHGGWNPRTLAHFKAVTPSYSNRHCIPPCACSDLKRKAVLQQECSWQSSRNYL